MDAEKWLRENTFRCPILNARISKKQCLEMQSRPSMQEWLSLFRSKYNWVNPRPEGCPCKQELKLS